MSARLESGYPGEDVLREALRGPSGIAVAVTLRHLAGADDRGEHVGPALELLGSLVSRTEEGRIRYTRADAVHLARALYGAALRRTGS